ncbi:polysaccharide deacetylase family protein [Thermoproteota archaeon]
MKRFISFVFLFTLIGLISAGIFYKLNKDHGYRSYMIPKTKSQLLAKIIGPQHFTNVQNPSNTEIKKYSTGSKSRLAVLVTDTSSSWLSLAHSLKSFGIPFVITKDYKRALKHKVVLVYPYISENALPKNALNALAKHPLKGGVLLGMNVVYPAIQKVFGFKGARFSKDHFELTFNTSQDLASTFTEPEEKVIKIGKKDVAGSGIRSFSYLKPSNTPLAVFNDGTAAITKKSFPNNGLAVAFGIDFGYLSFLGHGERSELILNSYINKFDPRSDVFYSLIKQIYEDYEGCAITLHTVPFNKSLSVILTHDLDYRHSIPNAIEYAKYEKSKGIKATYFVQTKYIQDHLDTAFFNDEGIHYIKQLSDMGMEIGSHSVSHSLVFDEFALGTGSEKYPSYKPYNQGPDQTTGGTILGELRVSKFLLESVIGNKTVISFRAGYLLNPPLLPQAVHASQFKYDSSGMSNFSLTHLPFQLKYDHQNTKELAVFEFPVTFDDIHWDKFNERKPSAVALAKKISKYGGLFNILIHPNIVGDKLAFEKKFVDAVKDFSWFGTLAEFGHWWSARNNIQLDVSNQGNSYIVHLNVPNPIKGLTLTIPDRYQFLSSTPKLNLKQLKNKLLIQEAQGNYQLRFKGD